MCSQRVQTHYLFLLSAWKYVCVHRLTVGILNSTLFKQIQPDVTKRSQSDCGILDEMRVKLNQSKLSGIKYILNKYSFVPSLGPFVSLSLLFACGVRRLDTGLGRI